MNGTWVARHGRIAVVIVAVIAIGAGLVSWRLTRPSSDDGSRARVGAFHVSYPPTSVADLHALGTAAGVPFRIASTLPTVISGCAAQEIDLVVPADAPQRDVVEAMATAYVQKLEASGRPGVIVANYRDKRQGSSGFTAGRLVVPGSCRSAPVHQVEVDAGGAASHATWLLNH